MFTLISDKLKQQNELEWVWIRRNITCHSAWGTILIMQKDIRKVGSATQMNILMLGPSLPIMMKINFANEKSNVSSMESIGNPRIVQSLFFEMKTSYRISMKWNKNKTDYLL